MCDTLINAFYMVPQVSSKMNLYSKSKEVNFYSVHLNLHTFWSLQGQVVSCVELGFHSRPCTNGFKYVIPYLVIMFMSKPPWGIGSKEEIGNVGLCSKVKTFVT